MLSYDLSDFWAHQLFRRQLSTFEDGSNFGAAKTYMLLFAVGTSLFMSDSSAFLAVEKGFEEQGTYA
jgi:hypothetical protein